MSEINTSEIVKIKQEYLLAEEIFKFLDMDNIKRILPKCKNSYANEMIKLPYLVFINIENKEITLLFKSIV
jgi:hypothetical protein